MTKSKASSEAANELDDQELGGPGVFDLGPIQAQLIEMQNDLARRIVLDAMGVVVQGASLTEEHNARFVSPSTLEESLGADAPTASGAEALTVHFDSEAGNMGFCIRHLGHLGAEGFEGVDGADYPYSGYNSA